MYSVLFHELTETVTNRGGYFFDYDGYENGTPLCLLSTNL